MPKRHATALVPDIDPLMPTQWKPANPSRGRNHVDEAVAFIKAFPVGTRLTPEEFDEWASQQQLLTVPHDAPKQSDAWKAHLQRRNELRYLINKAGTHPRMALIGQPTFTCDTVFAGRWEVRVPHHAMAERGLPARLQKLITTKRKQLRYLVEGTNWAALPPHERMWAEHLSGQIDHFTRHLRLDTDILDEEFSKFQKHLKMGIEAGSLSNNIPGVQGFLALNGETSPKTDEPAGEE